MINREEYAICKRRGHPTFVEEREGWLQCEACGMWLRKVITIEEREDAPPENEQSCFQQLRKGK